MRYLKDHRTIKYIVIGYSDAIKKAAVLLL